MNDVNGLDQGLSRLTDLSPKGYALGLHIRYASAHLMIQTYDASWTEVYTEKGYMLGDPTVFWGFGEEGAIRWSEIELPDPHGILDQAKAHGLTYGLTVSYGPTSSRTIGGFARSDREFTDEEIRQIQDIVQELHEKSTPPEQLTSAQRMALRLIAKGSRHAEAAALLGISESALKARLRSARERLFVRTTAEAVQRAQEYNLL
ncbi:autoinducer binding domain-containing protein [Aliiroseovarius crassostreae]|uniref:helix-turn-helix transcriptional regulator n=1 Tax=Aliiroseovarius crassostreae TaxID=154981 RepID=UPI0022018099|nr:autoinducer binding domain-containing protein [Aliiroseovarius crassostreae]UWP92537.1 autoinducer binding domain-containing protein [Aliiroseovarius crassostreae]UWP98848.1 autoinducer binding domain-containing protein [Aliiroseovarius crassostreae]UWQ02045.1 autoinducer binding domain-containing protein [Aliiroseovarius crassostreae]UWQ05172.1 autoinducer binding domain-containing protein [Aliiroseovarius crassostreae]